MAEPETFPCLVCPGCDEGGPCENPRSVSLTRQAQEYQGARVHVESVLAAKLWDVIHLWEERYGPLEVHVIDIERIDNTSMGDQFRTSLLGKIGVVTKLPGVDA